MKNSETLGCTQTSGPFGITTPDFSCLSHNQKICGKYTTKNLGPHKSPLHPPSLTCFTHHFQVKHVTPTNPPPKKTPPRKDAKLWLGPRPSHLGGNCRKFQAKAKTLCPQKRLKLLANFLGSRHDGCLKTGQAVGMAQMAQTCFFQNTWAPNEIRDVPEKSGNFAKKTKTG